MHMYTHAYMPVCAQTCMHKIHLLALVHLLQLPEVLTLAQQPAQILHVLLAEAAVREPPRGAGKGRKGMLSLHTHPAITHLPVSPLSWNHLAVPNPLFLHLFLPW